MAERVGGDGGRDGISPRAVGWGVAALLLLVPLLAGWPWTPSDYVFAAVLFGIVGGGIELAVRESADRAYRAGAVVAIGTAFVLVWVNAAVGILGGEANPANLLFGGVVAVAALGALLARFRPAGTARAMIAAAVAQAAVGLAALAFGLGSSGTAGIYEALVGGGVLALPWLGAAALFRRAAAR